MAGLLNIVVGDQNTDILLFQAFSNALDVLNNNGIHSGKWLIEQNETRIYRECPSDLSLLRSPPLSRSPLFVLMCGPNSSTFQLGLL